jgi:hypothetical protein
MYGFVSNPSEMEAFEQKTLPLEINASVFDKMFTRNEKLK